MRISVSAPGHDLDSDAHSSIERDLEKLARRLHRHDDAATRVRLTGGSPAEGWHAVLEVDYGKTHLMAKSTNGDMGQAIRAAREEILRQVNDRSRGGHSSFSKGT